MREIAGRDWWRVALHNLSTGQTLSATSLVRITIGQQLGFYDKCTRCLLVPATVAPTLAGIVTLGLFVGAMLPFCLRCLDFDCASAPAPLVATSVGVTVLIIYFGGAATILRSLSF